MPRTPYGQTYVAGVTITSRNPVRHCRSGTPRDVTEALDHLKKTSIYLHADMTIKERALALMTPVSVRPGRYSPPDSLLAFLESL